jgi:hypothetical protein
MANSPSNELKQRGAVAEKQFRDWLDRCALPHMYVEQSPLTVPKGLKGEIKRPDFLVGIPSVGTIAFDVKAKSVYDNHIIINEYEHRTFQNFENFFNITVWYACFPPDEPPYCHLVMNRTLADLSVVKKRGEACIQIPLKHMVLADPRRDFMTALISAIKLQ